MKADPAIEEIRRARIAISREHGNNPKRLVEYFMERPQRSSSPLIHGPDEHTLEEEPGAPDGTSGPT